MRASFRQRLATPHRSRVDRGRRFLAIAVLRLTGVAVYGARRVLGLFLSPWEQALEASRARVALVSTVGFLVFAADEPLAGRLLAKVPGRRLVLLGVALRASAFAGAALADSL